MHARDPKKLRRLTRSAWSISPRSGAEERDETPERLPREISLEEKKRKDGTGSESVANASTPAMRLWAKNASERKLAG